MPRHAQTEKTTFSCKDNCIMTKHTRRSICLDFGAHTYFWGHEDNFHVEVILTFESSLFFRVFPYFGSSLFLETSSFLVFLSFLFEVVFIYWVDFPILGNFHILRLSSKNFNFVVQRVTATRHGIILPEDYWWNIDSHVQIGPWTRYTIISFSIKY